MEETVEGQHGDAQAVQEIAQEHPAVSAAPVSVSNPEATAQWQQAMQHWQALQQQGQQGRPKNAPFYPVGGGHPAYSLWAGQPLMYGGPFYSMPFTYPPASTTAQMPTDQAAGVAPSVVETKPSDADGEPNHDDDDSDPASNGEGIAGQESDKLGDGAVQQSQGQPEGLQYLLPPDASGNQAAALAALLRANQGGENAELWRQQAAQLAGSGVDLSQLAAQAAGPGVHPLQDEREVKRQRRKQSNRESARRSRLRKQSECEALAIKVRELEEENIKLKETVRMLEGQLQATMGKAPTG